jgi:uncharacterized protein YjiS (DUF1127 family)
MTRTYASHASAFRAVVALRVVGGMVRAAAGLFKALRHRREVGGLAQLDDRLLKDIGLTRGDVRGALAGPAFRDPSVLLVRCAGRPARASAVKHPRPTVPVARRA